MSSNFPGDIYKIKLGSDELNFNNFYKSKEFERPLYEKFYEKTTKYFLRRTLKNFIKINSIASDDYNNTNFREKLYKIAELVLNPFIGYDYETGENASFRTPNKTKISSSIIRCKDILQNIFGTNNINFLFDFSKIGINSNKNIKIYFDYIIKDYKKTIKDPLNYIRKNGFLQFENPKNVMITIIIPIDFLEELASKHLHIMPRHGETSSMKPREYDIMFGKSKYISIQDFKDEFTNIFFQNFVISLYKERYRESLYSQLYLLFNIAESEQFLESSNLRLSEEELEEKFKSKYYKIFEDFDLISNGKSEDITELSPTISDVMGELLPDSNLTSFSVNPIDVYNRIFELGVYECTTYARKLNFRNILSGTEYLRFDSSLLELNKDFGDSYSNLVTDLILLKRLIPVIYFSEFIICNGDKSSVFTNMREKIKAALVKYDLKYKSYVYSNNLKEVIESIANDLEYNKTAISVFVRQKLLKNFIFKLSRNYR